MKISKKIEYGLRALLVLVRQAEKRSLRIQELAQSEKIPVKFLEQIFLALRKAGILQSKRGAQGGYRLARKAEEISVLEVIEALEGSLSLIEPAGDEVGTFLKELEENLRQILSNESLQDLASRSVSTEHLHFEI